MRIFRTLMVIFFALATCSSMAFAGSTNGARPALLEALDGHWVATGDVMGKAVKYDVNVFPTLQGTFTEIHMRDVQVPSQYEARVFIGEGKDGKIIVHWLDSFGADGSFPHGTGAIKSNTLVFYIPYPDGKFRDTLTLQPGRKTWTLSIEAAKPDGRWVHFAKYEIRKSSGEH